MTMLNSQAAVGGKSCQVKALFESSFLKSLQGLGGEELSLCSSCSMQPQQTGVGQGTPGACTHNLVQRLAGGHPQVKSIGESWRLGLTVHPPVYYLL